MKTALWTVRGGPLWVAYHCVRDRGAIDRDVKRLTQPRLDMDLHDRTSDGERLRAFSLPEFRSLFYERLRSAGGLPSALASLLKRLYRGQTALHFCCEDIGPGLYVSHGFATIVLAKRIGTDCLISQQVTIGYSDKGGPPVLGDRVRLGAGAIVVGPITVGDDAVVGAGAVVVHDVPPGAVVAGVPARVLPNAEDRFSALRQPTRAN